MKPDDEKKKISSIIEIETEISKQQKEYGASIFPRENLVLVTVKTECK